jgi:hypothetical protein
MLPTFNLQTKFSELNLLLYFSTYLNNDLSQPAENSVFVLLDKMNELRINSSLTSPIPFGFLIFQDIRGEFINMVGNNNIFFTVEITRWLDEHGSASSTPTLTTDKILHRFYVTKFDIIEHTLDRDLIRLEFKSLNEMFLGQTKAYSTAGEKQVDKILEDLAALAQPGGNSGDASKVQDLELFFPTGYTTNKTLSYCSTTNSTILDSIDYILDWGFDPGMDGLSFITSELSTGNLVFWSQKHSLYTPTVVSTSDASSEAVRHSGLIPTPNKIAQMERIMCQQITLKSFKGYDNIFHNLSPLTEAQFDFDTGTWKEEATTNDVLTAIASTAEDTNDVYVPKLNPWIPQNLTALPLTFNAVRTLTNGEPRLREKYLPLLLDNNLLGVTLEGFITRQAGDPFIMLVDAAVQSRKTANMLAGPWTVLQVTHIFRPNDYKNELLLGRNEKIRDSSVIEFSLT